MNRKKLNIGLIVILVAIYGAVMFKYFGAGNVEIADQESFVRSVPKKSISPKQDFQLIISDRDPFLDKIAVETIRKRKPLRHAPSAISHQTKREAVSWPTIEYYGFLKAKSNAAKRAVLKINGKRHDKRKGDKIGKLKIIQIYSDSIKVAFFGRSRTIYKNKRPSVNNAENLVLEGKY